jgi:hypothetical protein
MLWGTASNSDDEILQRFQFKTLRSILNAPSFINNHRIHEDLQVNSVLSEIKKWNTISFFLWLYIPIQALAVSMKLTDFTSVTRFRTVGRTPWTGDQLVARPLPVHKHRKSHTQHKHLTSISWMGFEPTVSESVPAKIVHALDRSASVRASEDSSCLRPRGYCEQRNTTTYENWKTTLMYKKWIY